MFEAPVQFLLASEVLFCPVTLDKGYRLPGLSRQVCVNQHLEDLLIPAQMLTITDDDVEDYGVSFAASGEPMNPKDKPILIVTCGVESAGIADKSQMKSREFHKLIKSLDQGSYSLTLKNDERVKTLDWDLRERPTVHGWNQES